jgi:hypothetical protein
MVITVPEHKKSEIIMYTFVTVIRTHGSEISWWSVIVLFLLSEGNESITSRCLLVTILCKHDYSSLIITEAVWGNAMKTLPLIRATAPEENQLKAWETGYDNNKDKLGMQEGAKHCKEMKTPAVVIKILSSNKLPLERRAFYIIFIEHKL